MSAWPRFVCSSLAVVIGGFLGLLPSAPAAETTSGSGTNAVRLEPPRMAIVLPLALKSGATNRFVVRGLGLTNVTAARFSNEWPGATLLIQSSAKAEVPKELDAKRVGDTQLEILAVLPNRPEQFTNWLVLDSSVGSSAALPVLVIPADLLVDENEPNGSLRDAKTIRPGQIVRGAIQEAGDVDVFKVDLPTGTPFRIEVWASPAGSTLDSLVTVRDARGNLVAQNDDAVGGVDSVVTGLTPSGGPLTVTLQDANDKGGSMHIYALRFSVEGPRSTP